MTERNEFKRLMHCGHGRCYFMLSENKELYKELLLYGCTHDISYDIQCEGSRAAFIYELVNEYDDKDIFIEKAAERIMSCELETEETDSFYHLCDLMVCFKAEDILKQKYAQMYKSLMNTRVSRRHNDRLNAFDYLTEKLVSMCDIKAFENIAADLGAYFIRRRRADIADLNWSFQRIFDTAVKKYGADITQKINVRSKELSRFSRVMSYKEEAKPYRTGFSYTADDEKISLEQYKKAKEQLLQYKEYDSDTAEIFIKGYSTDDESLLRDILENLRIESRDMPYNNWHDIVLALIEKAEEGSLPDDVLFFIYENSLCSCCRSDAVKIMSERNILTEKIINECMHDSNEKTRSIALKNSMI